MELSQETIFCDIKECLLYFNYPLAHCMSDNELGDVFNTSNRCFLVTWMLKLYLGDVYQNNMDVTERDNLLLLGDLLHELGFCTKKQRLPFMKGDLDLNAQIEILYKMFKSIKSLNSSTQQENTNPISCEEIMMLSHNGLNLFPMYGDIKTSDSVETDTNSMEEIYSANNRDNTVNEIGGDIEYLMEQAQEKLNKVESGYRNIPDTANSNKQDQKRIVFHPESSKILKSCVDSAKQISLLFENLNTIGKFSKNDNISKKEWTGIEGTQDMIKSLLNEIVVTLRYQQMK